jgi:hypothetical protein
MFLFEIRFNVICSTTMAQITLLLQTNDALATFVGNGIRKRAAKVGLALRSTELQNDVPADVRAECLKLFDMYRCFKKNANPAKQDMFGVANALVGLFELYVHYPLPPPPPSPPVAMAINKHDDC